jgi:hypothetical protein
MFRTLAFFVGLVALLACSIAAQEWRLSADAVAPQVSQAQLQSAYDRIHPGVTPASQLGTLGLDTKAAAKLSYLGVVEQLMPANSYGFDTLDPAVQSCLEAEGRCTAYVFAPARERTKSMVLLIQGGRVAYKAMRGLDRGGNSARSA